MSISCRGCPEGVTVKGGQRSAFARRSWIPSKNTSGISSHLHFQRWSINGRLANTCRPNPKAEFAAMHCATYERFAATQWDSCKEALAIARHTHQCALVAATLLEEKIECMSCSLICQCSGSCWHSGSCQHSGSLRCQRS